MRTEPRQPYTGHLEADRLCEKARKAAERDGRLRYLADGRITMKPPKYSDFFIFGALSWGVSIGGRTPWIEKVYHA